MSIVTGAKIDLTAARVRFRPARQNFASSLWGRMRSRIARWRFDRHSRAELARMSLRELRDIGITPAERDRECNRPIWPG